MPSHGALSKSGKVRDTTPKIEPLNRKSKIPKVRCRKLYLKRVLLGRNIGQFKRRRGYRR